MGFTWVHWKWTNPKTPREQNLLLPFCSLLKWQFQNKNGTNQHENGSQPGVCNNLQLVLRTETWKGLVKMNEPIFFFWLISALKPIQGLCRRNSVEKNTHTVVSGLKSSNFKTLKPNHPSQPSKWVSKFPETSETFDQNPEDSSSPSHEDINQDTRKSFMPRWYCSSTMRFTSSSTFCFKACCWWERCGRKGGFHLHQFTSVYISFQFTSVYYVVPMWNKDTKTGILCRWCLITNHLGGL